MQIEVVYGNAKKQSLITCQVKENCTVGEAIEQSGLLAQYPELNLSQLSVGIFSKQVTLSTILTPNDRIEIYRPLKIDPKQARRLRAKNLNFSGSK